MIDFKCPKCGQIMSAPDSLAGQAETCPGCRNVAVVPQASPGIISASVLASGWQGTRRKQGGGKRPTVNVHVKGVKTTNGLGVAALVLGIVAALTCWIPFVGILGVPLSILGLLFGVLGFLIALIGRRSRVGMPVSGTIVCVVALAVAIASTQAGVEAVDKALEKSPTISKAGGEPQETAQADKTSKSAPTIPIYEILKRDVYDAPIKTQVAVDALVTGTITKEGLEALLENLYSKENASSGFKYHSRPTHVFLYLYTSREHFASGMGQWIAMLQKTGAGDNPKITVKENLIRQLDAKPETKFGLSEADRRQIWKDLVLAEDRATKEAEKRYPLQPERSMSVGRALRLSRETPLMPELEPRDPLEDIGRMRRLQPGTIVRVTKVATKAGTPWYQVRAQSESGAELGSGWVNSMALVGQAGVDAKQQLAKQGDLMQTLKEKSKAEIARRHGLSAEQLLQISVEGVEKNWALPNSENRLP